MTYSLYGASFVYTFERMNVDVFGAVVRVTQSSHTEKFKICSFLTLPRSFSLAKSKHIQVVAGCCVAGSRSHPFILN